MEGRVARTCHVCGSNVGFTSADDGFFYCGYCNSQADDIFDIGTEEEQTFTHYSARFTRVRPSNIPAQFVEPISQVKFDTSQFLDHPNIEDAMSDGVGPAEPSDFASSQSQKNYSYQDYYTAIRSRYVMGLQLMIQFQSRALVEKFNVSPLIIGLVGPLWLRYLASTKIMADEWADRVVHDSEAQTQGEAEEFLPSASAMYKNEPVNIYGKRVAYVWCRSLRSMLPISCSLAISLLVCHVAREPILPTDILKWALEGKLPYFSAFRLIEKQLGPGTKACPIPISRMLRPVQVISSQKLESMAADIAQRISLKLPPVNFYGIASRYLRELSLPAGLLLPSACRIYEWSMPSELYLSANESRIPTRACVMTILIVAIRTLFDINGYGMWESSLSRNEDHESQSHSNKIENTDDAPSSYDSKSSATMDPMLSVQELLQILDSKYYERTDAHEYTCDLPTYLQYCKDVVFSGLKPSFEDIEEEKLIDELWAFYQNNKDARTPDVNERCSEDSKKRKDEVRSRGEQSDDSDNGDECSKCSTDRYNCCHRNQDSASSSRKSEGSSVKKEKALKQLKLDMEENQFCYIPPRVKVKRRDYLHYARRRKGVLIYAVHADYYILLRSCAKVAQVETRIMHVAVLSLERRLQWLEKRIDHSLLLHTNLDGSCEFCEGDDVENDTSINDSNI